MTGYGATMTEFASALGVARAIRERRVSPTEVLTHYLSVVDELDPTLNAFCFRDDERAMADAEAATRAVMDTPAEELAPFHGVPVPIKDLLRVKGWPTSYGSQGASDDPADGDDAPIRRLRDAGFVLMGKTTTAELGTISVTETERFGATRNPWNPDHTPGGSSGGAGAALAAGMAPLAVGTDGGGSIRIPSSCCGLVGLKPSRNRITDDASEMAAITTSGMLTRTVADAAASLDVLARPDPGAWNSAPAPARPFSDEVGVDPGVLRIRVAANGPLGPPVAEAYEAALEVTAALLERLGHRVEVAPLDWPDATTFLSGLLTVWSTISATVPLADPERLEPHNLATAQNAAATSSLDYARAIDSLQLMSREMTARFVDEFDVLVTPTMAVEPPAVGSIFEGAEEDPGVVVLNSSPMATYTAPFNITGQPAVSLPMHRSDSGLPTGVQFVGGPWSEALLIRLASQIESQVLADSQSPWGAAAPLSRPTPAEWN